MSTLIPILMNRTEGILLDEKSVYAGRRCGFGTWFGSIDELVSMKCTAIDILPTILSKICIMNIYSFIYQQDKFKLSYSHI
jgi:hypothetical protein